MQGEAHGARAVVAGVRPGLVPAAEAVRQVGDHVSGLDDRGDHGGCAGRSRREAVGADRPGARRRRGDLPGRLVGQVRRRAAVRRRLAALRRAQRDRTGHATRAGSLLEHAHLALREHTVDAQSGGALEQAHARPRRRAELPVGRRAIAEPGQVVLQHAHVLALRSDAQAADAEPAPVARAAALRAAEDAEEALRHPRRTIEPGVGAQRAHHGRRVRPELPVHADGVAEACEHALQLAHRGAGLARVQPAQGGRPRGAALGCGHGRRNKDAGGEYRNEEEYQRLRRTVCETVGSRHGFRMRQGVSRDAGAGRARRRGCARRGFVSAGSDPTGGNLACRGSPKNP